MTQPYLLGLVKKIEDKLKLQPQVPYGVVDLATLFPEGPEVQDLMEILESKLWRNGGISDDAKNPPSEAELQGLSEEEVQEQCQAYYQEVCGGRLYRRRSWKRSRLMCTPELEREPWYDERLRRIKKRDNTLSLSFSETPELKAETTYHIFVQYLADGGFGVVGRVVNFYVKNDRIYFKLGANGELKQTQVIKDPRNHYHQKEAEAKKAKEFFLELGAKDNVDKSTDHVVMRFIEGGSLEEGFVVKSKEVAQLEEGVLNNDKEVAQSGEGAFSADEEVVQSEEELDVDTVKTYKSLDWLIKILIVYRDTIDNKKRVHLDIKPDNIMKKGPTFIDAAACFSKKDINNIRFDLYHGGTPGFLSAERLSEISHIETYDCQKAAVYSFGIIFAQMLGFVTEQDFDRGQENQLAPILIKKRVKEQIHAAINEKLKQLGNDSVAIKNLIEGMINDDWKEERYELERAIHDACEFRLQLVLKRALPNGLDKSDRAKGIVDKFRKAHNDILEALKNGLLDKKHSEFTDSLILILRNTTDEISGNVMSDVGIYDDEIIDQIIYYVLNFIPIPEVAEFAKSFIEDDSLTTEIVKNYFIDLANRVAEQASLADEMLNELKKIEVLAGQKGFTDIRAKAYELGFDLRYPINVNKDGSRRDIKDYTVKDYIKAKATYEKKIPRNQAEIKAFLESNEVKALEAHERILKELKGGLLDKRYQEFTEAIVLILRDTADKITDLKIRNKIIYDVLNLIPIPEFIPELAEFAKSVSENGLLTTDIVDDYFIDLVNRVAEQASLANVMLDELEKIEVLARSKKRDDICTKAYGLGSGLHYTIGERDDHAGKDYTVRDYIKAKAAYEEKISENKVKIEAFLESDLVKDLLEENKASASSIALQGSKQVLPVIANAQSSSPTDSSRPDSGSAAQGMVDSVDRVVLPPDMNLSVASLELEPLSIDSSSDVEESSTSDISEDSSTTPLADISPLSSPAHNGGSNNSTGSRSPAAEPVLEDNIQYHGGGHPVGDGDSQIVGNLPTTPPQNPSTTPPADISSSPSSAHDGGSRNPTGSSSNSTGRRSPAAEPVSRENIQYRVGEIIQHAMSNLEELVRKHKFDVTMGDMLLAKEDEEFLLDIVRDEDRWESGNGVVFDDEEMGCCAGFFSGKKDKYQYCIYRYKSTKQTKREKLRNPTTGKDQYVYEVLVERVGAGGFGVGYKNFIFVEEDNKIRFKLKNDEKKIEFKHRFNKNLRKVAGEIKARNVDNIARDKKKKGYINNYYREFEQAKKLTPYKAKTVNQEIQDHQAIPDAWQYQSSVSMEYFPKMHLRAYLEKKRTLSLDEAIDIIDAIMYSYDAYFIRNGLIHLDIKLDNIMYDPDTNKVAFVDFGAAFTEDALHQCDTSVGTYFYMPPEIEVRKAEVITRKTSVNQESVPYSSVLNEKTPVYSLGVVFSLILGYAEVANTNITNLSPVWLDDGGVAGVVDGVIYRRQNIPATMQKARTQLKDIITRKIDSIPANTSATPSAASAAPSAASADPSAASADPSTADFVPLVKSMLEDANVAGNGSTVRPDFKAVLVALDNIKANHLLHDLSEPNRMYKYEDGVLDLVSSYLKDILNCAIDLREKNILQMSFKTFEQALGVALADTNEVPCLPRNQENQDSEKEKQSLPGDQANQDREGAKKVLMQFFCDTLRVPAFKGLKSKDEILKKFRSLDDDYQKNLDNCKAQCARFDQHIDLEFINILDKHGNEADKQFASKLFSSYADLHHTITKNAEKKPTTLGAIIDALDKTNKKISRWGVWIDWLEEAVKLNAPIMQRGIEGQEQTQNQPQSESEKRGLTMNDIRFKIAMKGNVPADSVQPAVQTQPAAQTQPAQPAVQAQPVQAPAEPAQAQPVQPAAQTQNGANNPTANSDNRAQDKIGELKTSLKCTVMRYIQSSRGRLKHYLFGGQVSDERMQDVAGLLDIVNREVDVNELKKNVDQHMLAIRSKVVFKSELVNLVGEAMDEFERSCGAEQLSNPRTMYSRQTS